MDPCVHPSHLLLKYIFRTAEDHKIHVWFEYIKKFVFTSTCTKKYVRPDFFSFCGTLTPEMVPWN